MGENPVEDAKTRRDRRFQLELVKIQLAESYKANIGIGLYVLGATFLLGAFTMTDTFTKVICAGFGLAIAAFGVYQYSRWDKSRDHRFNELERDYC